MLEHPEIGWIERTGYPSWMQEQEAFCEGGSEAPRERQVERNDVIKIKPADPDSHFKLLPCKCGSDNVAYVHYNGRGGAKWRVTCFDCCHTVDKGCRVRHDAQIAWNTEVST